MRIFLDILEGIYHTAELHYQLCLYLGDFGSFYFAEVVLQVTLIARGDVLLSIVMTVCTTLGAVVLTPLLTNILAGTYVAVDALQLSISTLQVTSNLCSTTSHYPTFSE